MVLLEDILNNVKNKVYGRPGEVSPRFVYYCVIEEQELTLSGDCIIFQSPIQLSVHGVPYTIEQTRSILPVWLIRDQIEAEPLQVPVKYISFYLPERLKLNLQSSRLENQAGIVFIEE